MRLLPVITASLALSACAGKQGQTASERARPGRVEVLSRDGTGGARVGRRWVGPGACDWELVVVEGRGWAQWARVPGRPEIAPGPGGEMVAWATCDGPALTWLVIGMSPDLHDQVPPVLQEARWLGPAAVHLGGTLLDGSPAPSVRFGMRESDWVPVVPDCVPVVYDTETTVLLDGTRVSVLLWDDLSNDGRDELVTEVPDSCGTARCAALVHTPCKADRLVRPIGQIDHYDGVLTGPAAEDGWRELRTRHAEGEDLWRVVDGIYQRVPQP